MGTLDMELFECIWHDIPTGLWVSDELGNITACNTAFSQMMGTTETDLLYDRWEAHVHVDDREDVVEWHYRMFSEETNGVLSFRSKHPDGEVRYLECRIRPLFDDNEFAGGMGIVRDITKQATTQRNLVQLEKELLEKEKLATIGQTTAVVAHELRNPLGTIRNSLYVLEQICNDPDHHEHIERAVRGILRCDSIINELLDFTKTVEHKRRPADIKKLITTVVEDYQGLNQIKIRTRFCRTKKIWIVESKIERAILNMIQNAVEAISGNPEIEEGAIYIRTMTRNDRFWIMVADNGPRIEEEYLERIFEPLFSTKGFGVGLGLPVCRKVFEEHGGGLKARNLKKGVVFAGWINLQDKA